MELNMGLEIPMQLIHAIIADRTVEMIMHGEGRSVE